MKKRLLRVAGLLALAVCLCAGCTSVSKNITTVSPAMQRYEISSCMVLPFLSEEGSYAGGYPRVMYNGAEKITGLVRDRLTETFPYVLDRYTTYRMIEDADRQLAEADLSLEDIMKSSFDADAVIAGKVIDYNPSRVGFFIKCVYLRDEETLWTGEVEVKVSGATLDIEKAANLAVEKVIGDLEAKLGR